VLAISISVTVPQVVEEHLLSVKAFPDARRMIICLSWRLRVVEKDHNLVETLLQQIVLFSLWGARSALQEYSKHVIYGERLSLPSVALYPWADFINPCMNVRSTHIEREISLLDPAQADLSTDSRSPVAVLGRPQRCRRMS
jgi:hypothetical protein